MALEVNVTKNLGNNFVQVEVDNKNVPKRFFQVPENKADEFCKSYKQYHTEESIFSSIRTLVPILLVTGAVNHFAKNLGKFAQWGLAIVSGLATAYGVINLNTKLLIKKEDKLLQKFSAQEIEVKP